jgi:hypothetical protein
MVLSVPAAQNDPASYCRYAEERDKRTVARASGSTAYRSGDSGCGGNTNHSHPPAEAGFMQPQLRQILSSPSSIMRSPQLGQR